MLLGDQTSVLSETEMTPPSKSSRCRSSKVRGYLAGPPAAAKDMDGREKPTMGFIAGAFLPGPR